MRQERAASCAQHRGLFCAGSEAVTSLWRCRILFGCAPAAGWPLEARRFAQARRARPASGAGHGTAIRLQNGLSAALVRSPRSPTRRVRRGLERATNLPNSGAGWGEVVPADGGAMGRPSTPTFSTSSAHGECPGVAPFMDRASCGAVVVHGQRRRGPCWRGCGSILGLALQLAVTPASHGRLTTRQNLLCLQA